MSNVIDTLLSVSHVTGGSSGGGGGGEAVLINKTAIANGTYTASDDNADGYKKFKVMVSNTYEASDEGKVVSNGALVSQTSDTATSNGTVDTTLINSLTVNVQGGGDAYAIARSILDRSITEYVDDQLTRIEGSALSGASKLATLRCHAVTYIGNQGCLGLKCTALAFPSLTSMGITAFRNCSQLAAFDFGPSLGSIPVQTFSNCSSLTAVVLRRATVMGMSNVSAFEGTPFKSGGTGGTIYIPKALCDHLGDGTSLDYKAATNWSTYDAYGTITWAKIEGSIYETQYADGTPIPTT